MHALGGGLITHDNGRGHDLLACIHMHAPSTNPDAGEHSLFSTTWKNNA
jgi:hypothetical protein